MKRGVATPYGTTKRASRKNDWKFSPAAFFGREGFGEVYSAEQVYLGTLGAVKIVLLHGDQQVRDLIHAEARISARLRHPHLIPMVDFGLEEVVPYLVMMGAVHGTLRTLYPRSSQVSPPRVVWHVQHIA
jgi:eukaryotic-like serine/threonine-protein kinase